VTTVVVTGIGVGSAVVIGGTVWTVVGIVVGAGVPRFIEQPAIQTDAIRSAATSKMVIFLFIVVTAYFFIQIIVMESPRAGKKLDTAFQRFEKNIKKESALF
jgi:hypothetical protein